MKILLEKLGKKVSVTPLYMGANYTYLADQFLKGNLVPFEKLSLNDKIVTINQNVENFENIININNLNQKYILGGTYFNFFGKKQGSSEKIIELPGVLVDAAEYVFEKVQPEDVFDTAVFLDVKLPYYQFRQKNSDSKKIDGKISYSIK